MGLVSHNTCSRIVNYYYSSTRNFGEDMSSQQMFELGVLLGRIEEKLERIEESMNDTWWYVKKWQKEKEDDGSADSE